MLQVIEAALQCIKSNALAAMYALPILKPALASLVQEGRAVQRPGILCM